MEAISVFSLVTGCALVGLHNGYQGYGHTVKMNETNSNSAEERQLPDSLKWAQGELQAWDGGGDDFYLAA